VSIKQSLFISNILMLVIPVSLSVMVIFVMASAFIDVFDLDDGFAHELDDFNDVVEEVQELVYEWMVQGQGDISQIMDDVEDFREYFRGDLSLAIYQGGERVHTVGRFEECPIIAFSLTKPGGSYFVMNHVGIYTLDVGAYKIILRHANYQPFSEFDLELEFERRREEIAVLAILLIVVVVVIALLTNRFLTRMVFRHIIAPLDTLVDGVHKIRDGDLAYRISYKGNNEFSTVCKDFNEMAEKLLEMVNAQQKDERNRKELFAGISHDLRTPIASIRNYVEGIEYGVASTPQMQKRYLKIIKDKTKDLEYIINQLFHFSKLDIGEFPMQMKSCDMSQFLLEFVKTISDEYEQKGLKITLTENVQSTVVNIDITQFRNVLTNILENSVKYGDAAQGVMDLTCKRELENAVITLTDNGPGVATGMLDMLFDTFYRGDKSRKNPSQGSGLGLAISAKTVERFGGTIKAINPSEGGLAIIIKLPIIKGAILDETDNEKDINY